MGDVVDPAVDAQGACRQARCHHRLRAQMVQLRDHVLFGHAVQRIRALWIVPVMRGDMTRRIGVLEPRCHGGHVFQRLRLEHGLHRATVGMPADHDVPHAQHSDGVFDRRHHAADVLRVRRHHIADIAIDEQFAWLCGEDQLRHDARICAGDEQRMRALAARQLLKARTLARIDFLTEMTKTF